jgi:hypothetical protein
VIGALATEERRPLHRVPGARNGIGTFGVLRAMEILREVHPDAKPEDKLFATPHRHGMKKLLEAANLRKDSKGRFRTAKTLRHTS